MNEINISFYDDERTYAMIRCEDSYMPVIEQLLSIYKSVNEEYYNIEDFLRIIELVFPYKKIKVFPKEADTSIYF